MIHRGELAARHDRVFAAHQKIVDPAHQNELERLCERRRVRRQDVLVEQRPLALYDQLIA